MITVTKTDIVGKLNIELNDDDNFTYTPEEKIYAVERAIEDTSVYSILDVSLPVTGSRDYLLDDHIQSVHEVGLDRGSGFEDPLPHRYWRHRTGDNTIVIDRSARYIATGTLIAQVSWKYSAEDEIPTYFEEYILQLALVKTLDILSQTKVGRFLKNDTTMGEMISKLNEARQNVQVLKSKLRHNQAVRL